MVAWVLGVVRSVGVGVVLLGVCLAEQLSRSFVLWSRLPVQLIGSNGSEGHWEQCLSARDCSMCLTSAFDTCSWSLTAGPLVKRQL